MIDATTAPVAPPDTPTHEIATQPIPAVDLVQMLHSFEARIDEIAEEMEQCVTTQPLGVKRGLIYLRDELQRMCAMARHTAAQIGAGASLVDCQRQVESVARHYVLSAGGGDPNASGLL